MPISASRRDSLKHLLGASSLGAAAALTTSPAQAARQRLELDDPIKALETRIKIMGSLKDETVTSFMRLNIYGDPENAHYIPFFTMNNLLIDKWERVAEDHFILTKYEAGFYTEFDSQTPINSWKNPFTGEEVEVFNFRLGPVIREYKPDEIIAMAYAPDPLPIEVIGERVFLATQSMASGPTFFTKEEYPIEAGDGEVDDINSFMTWSAELKDVTNKKMASVPVHMQLQNRLPWAPWFRMRGRQGGTSVRGFGSKIDGIDALPKPILAGFEKYTPEILATDQWEDSIFETFDYMRHIEEKKANGTYK